MKVEGHGLIDPPLPRGSSLRPRSSASLRCRYAIYGVFGYCPDCGLHNSLQILRKNLELAEKEITWRPRWRAIWPPTPRRDALKCGLGLRRLRPRDLPGERGDGVSREAKENLVPKSYRGAGTTVQEQYAFDLTSGTSADDWTLRCACSAYLLAHKLGVVDEDYLRATGDADATLGPQGPHHARSPGSDRRTPKLGSVLVAGVKRTTVHRPQDVWPRYPTRM